MKINNLQGELTGISAIKKSTASPLQNGTGAKGKPLSKHQMRQRERARRAAEWEAFNKTKPDDDYENPDDVAAIRDAERNMGDFKLKSDPNFVPPDDERVTPQRKRQQMLLLEDGMYQKKMDFNRRFLALRDVKRAVCAAIADKNVELRSVNKELKIADVCPYSSVAILAETSLRSPQKSLIFII